jgi:hypothetical protein
MSSERIFISPLLGWSMSFGKVTASPTPAFPKRLQTVALISAPFPPDPVGAECASTVARKQVVHRLQVGGELH